MTSLQPYGRKFVEQRKLLDGYLSPTKVKDYIPEQLAAARATLGLLLEQKVDPREVILR